MPRVIVDCRFAAGNSGLGRYTRELVTHLVRRAGDIRYVLLVRSRDESWLRDLADSCDVLETNIAHYSLAEQLQLPRILRSSKADLLFSPHFNIPLLCPLPHVVTIHDLILHRFPNAASLPKRLAYKFLVQHAIRSAMHVIAISAFTESEIRNVYGKELPVTAVLEGVNPLYTPQSVQRRAEVKEAYALEKDFFLYVGNAKEHKNVRTLIRAFEKADLSDHELILVCGGVEAERLKPLPAGVRIISDVPDTDLPALYSAAMAFVTASLYEGFCLPVAEALACGCPVIATNGSAIREIAEGHAMLIEPTIDAFAEAMKHPPAKPIPFVVGTWDRTAQQTELIHRRALAS